MPCAILHAGESSLHDRDVCIGAFVLVNMAHQLVRTSSDLMALGPVKPRAGLRRITSLIIRCLKATSVAAMVGMLQMS